MIGIAGFVLALALQAQPVQCVVTGNSGPVRMQCGDRPFSIEFSDWPLDIWGGIMLGAGYPAEWEGDNLYPLRVLDAKEREAAGAEIYRRAKLEQERWRRHPQNGSRRP